MLCCMTDDLVHFCFGDVLGIYAAYCRTLIVYFEHHLHCMFRAHRKESLQHFDHELHRGVIIVQ